MSRLETRVRFGIGRATLICRAGGTTVIASRRRYACDSLVSLRCILNKSLFETSESEEVGIV
jgi:hypothetical protein